MIAANELRIGNWVDDFFNKPCRIESIDNDGYDIYYLEHYRLAYLPIKETNPIPLTPEILEKCGFEKQMMWTYAIDIEGSKKLVYYLGEKGWSIGNKNYSDSRNLNYLHQLQNLYFALTGKELTYNP